jgi:type I restriction enzyme S subunit
MPRADMGDVMAFDFPLPPRPEQLRIVGVLDEAFAAVATARANTEQNLRNARDMFESHLDGVFSQRGKGWAVRPLGDLCRVRTGKKDVNQGNPDGAYPFFTCASRHTYSDTYSFETEALLVAGNGNVGQVSYYSGKFEAYQRTYVLSDFNLASARYLFRVLDKRLSAVVSKQKLGNTMPYIKLGMLTSFPVPVPSKQEQQRIVAELDAISADTERLASIYQRKLTALDALKQSLLHQAFTGAL